MPAVAASTASAATSTINASRHALKPTPLLAPAAAFAAYRYRHEIVDRCTKIFEGHKTSNSPIVVCESVLPTLPKLSINNGGSYGPHQHLHASSTKEKPLSRLSAASTSIFGDPDYPSYRISMLSRQKRSSLKPPRAYKDDFFSFRVPVLTEKPEWWWRTLACVPYLIALQMSDVGYYIQPFLEHHDHLGDLIFFVPGAITKLPAWFTILYLYLAYLGIVKNKEWPHFFRYHVMMGMLLETAMQLVWYTSNFMPLVHYNGRFGMHYWAGIGFAYILIVLQCVRCALAGGYAHIPFISDAAYIHTLFNIGGFQRPF